MKSALKLFCVSLCFSISSGIAVAQSAPCSGDSGAAQASPIGCVTGEGVQVSTTSVPEKAPESPSLTPEQRPALPPLVIFAGGKLTVTAKNSTLADILRAVASKTGAVIDVPEGAEERVVTQLGPAPARDVMAALLNGSHYNYVMVGTETDSEAVAHIILTAKTDHADTATVASAGRPVSPRTTLQAAAMQPYQEIVQQQQAMQAQQAQMQEMQQQQTAASEAITPEPAAQATGDSGAGAGASAGAGAAQAGSASVADAAAAGAPPAAEPPARDGGPQGDRTPQQVLQDLYETRRQMIQQQRQPPPPPPQQ
jgi:hypothetical protein